MQTAQARAEEIFGDQLVRFFREPVDGQAALAMFFRPALVCKLCDGAAHEPEDECANPTCKCRICKDCAYLLYTCDKAEVVTLCPDCWINQCEADDCEESDVYMCYGCGRSCCLDHLDEKGECQDCYLGR